MIKKITSRIQMATISAAALATAYTQSAFAQIQQNNAQQGPVAATNIQGVAANVTGGLQTFQTLATLFASVAGLVLVANSLFNLYKASKDPSHQVKPMSGIIGLVIGGLLAVVGTVMTISTKSVVG